MNTLAFSLLPESASNTAGWVDALFYTLVTVCGLVTVLIAVAILYFCVRYRQGSTAPRRPHSGTSLALEITWSAITLGIFLAIFFWAAVIYFRMSKPPPETAEIHVIAKQWMWKVQHQNGRREINELHLPLGRPVKLVMSSQDVIHDFFVPAFRSKMDVLPGKYTLQWFTPTKAGKYRLFCAEYCGQDHSRMGGWIHVMEPADFNRWLGEGTGDESLIRAGARLFQSRGCTGCHAPSATVRAPLLEGIYGRPVPLAGGGTVLADEQYIHDSILLPMKDIVAGYAPVMPTFQGQLTDEEVLELVAYIKSLAFTPGAQP